MGNIAKNINKKNREAQKNFKGSFSRCVCDKNTFRGKHQLNEDKNLLNRMLSLIDSGVIALDPDGNIISTNVVFEKIMNLTNEEKNYSSISELFKHEFMKPLLQGFEYAGRNKTNYVIENQSIYTKHGKELTFKISINYTEIDENSFIIITFNDRTREVQLAKVKDIVIRLNNMLSRYYSLDDYFDDILRSLVGVIPYAELGSILLVDENNNITMEANVGYDREKAKQFRLKFEETFYYRCCEEDKTKPIIINNLELYCEEGKMLILDNIYGIKVASSLSTPIIIDGKLRALLNLDSSRNYIFDNQDLEIMQFLTEQISLVLTSHQLLNKTIYLSRYDQLTGLYNRWYLNELTKNTIPYCLKIKKNFYYVMMDLNNLKLANDIHGHLLGDTYLKEFSLLLKKYSSENDILIRIGGDEFAAVFYEIDKDTLDSKMKNINHELKTKMKKAINNGQCGFAYGFAQFPQECHKLEELIKIADKRMYVKKKHMKETNSL